MAETAVSKPGKKDVGSVVNQVMDPCATHLDAWASLRLMRAGGASAVEWEDVFPSVQDPDPLPFPSNHRGESIIRADEVEKDSERKYGRTRKDSPSIESMAATVERALMAFDGPENLPYLLRTVHPATGRCRPSAYPDDPFYSFVDKEFGPCVQPVTKKHLATSYEFVYSQFKSVLRREIKNAPVEKSA